MCPRRRSPTLTPRELGEQILRTASLPDAVATACQDALSRHGRLFSPVPVWSRTFLAWIDAVAEAPRDLFLPAAVACECMAAGYDLLDAAAPGEPDPCTEAASDALLRLSQDLLLDVRVPADCRLRAVAALRRAGGYALAAQRQDIALRSVRTASPDVLGILQQRSGTLVAATCQCAALLTGAHWRTVVLAGRFGMVLGCAAQLEDDLADLADDAASGRKTLPVLVAHQMDHDAPEMVAATTWVVVQQYLHGAGEALRRLPQSARTEALWMLLPADLRATWPSGPPVPAAWSCSPPSPPPCGHRAIRASPSHGGPPVELQ